jgi:murein DD-endopeptidase MepM/ murein hydrolase activator NlpD
MDFIQKLKERTAEEFKRLSIKRMLILFLIGCFTVSAAFCGVYIYCAHSVKATAAVPVKQMPAAAVKTTAAARAKATPVLTGNSRTAIPVKLPAAVVAKSVDKHIAVQAGNTCNAALMKEPFEYVCSKNKAFAFEYFKKRSKAKNVKFSMYDIKLKENFWTVAKKFDIDVDTIVGCNPEIKDMFARKGQLLIVPETEGVLHQIKPGESLKSIADTFGVEEKDIKGANWTGFFLSPGDILFIPDAAPAELNQYMTKIYEKRELFRSPLAGRYTSLKGRRKDPILQGVTKFHNGVDIGVPAGTWVGAAAAGTVLEAGWSNGGYGNYIRIAHKGGYTTLYGHLSHIYVHAGQTVKAGSLIAKSGSTGRSTGPHLHFSIFKGSTVLNPLDYLW